MDKDKIFFLNNWIVQKLCIVLSDFIHWYKC